MTRAAASVVGLMLAAAIAGCHAKSDKPAVDKTEATLGDRIVVDPAMTGESTSAAPESGITLSPASRSPESVEAARQSAAELAGGLQPLPTPTRGSASALAQRVAATAQVSPAARAAKTDCAGKVQYAAAWGTRLPAELPLYPRAAVQEAAGTDADGCALRVVSFGTPVGAGDVIGFYRAMALKAGYTAEYRLDGSDSVLGGDKAGRAYVVYARKQANGVTEVDLATSGH
ncbi:hypothetical protein EDF56_106425 [Novosphingobium sp. PhB165]|uniref:hypothetical protein n=1 Tax=Novosphingobium sp. PhB165 TaxID=2485105 RepID=UPI0010526A4C|nr:hypothetical protein [Novosphingobium sp. PhB165]TCM17308.1 hypothetical protein EDF56_106425 [Novosphingobium sp. PhB165]